MGRPCGWVAPENYCALDWTDFDADNQATIMLSRVTNHGRSTPLVWLTVDKATLKNHRNAYEYRVLVQLAEALPADVKVLVVADRGFGDQKLYQVLTEELKFDYLIRFRGNIAVTSADGDMRPAADWVGVGGRPRTLRNAFVTADGYQVGAVVCVHAKDMKEPGCLAASTTTDTAKQLMTTYGKRWSIEFWIPRYQGLTLWNGDGFDTRQHTRTTGSAVAVECLCRRFANIARSCRRGLGYDRHLSPTPQNSARIRCFVREPSLPRTYTNDARTPLAASDPTLRRYAARNPHVCWRLWHHLKNEGIYEDTNHKSEMHPNAGRPVAMNGGKAILWLKDGQATPFFKRIRAMSDVAAFKGRDEPCLQKGSQNQSSRHWQCRG